MKKKIVITQKAILALILPLMEKRGEVYKKKANVFAKEAKGGEEVETHTSDGKETVNQAKQDDFLVKNQTEAGEMYIISQKKFHDRYKFLHETEKGFSEYRSTGQILALEISADILKLLGQSSPFYFEAPWKEDVIAKKGDFLAIPLDKSEVYRIARKEFFETYGGKSFAKKPNRTG